MPNASSSSDSQAAVIEWLANPATFGLGEVKRFDTHAASVFLAGDRVIKIKRRVRYPFLDYSTLKKREAACRAELAINRKFAPQLYRRVVAITRQADGSLGLGGSGEPVEWAVEMTRFDENKTLDHLAERGELNDDLAGKLATAVAAMHERAEPFDPATWLDAVAGFVTENTKGFRPYGDIFPPRSVEELEQTSLAALARLRPLLKTRGKQNLIRRGHGDLHLGNIAMLDGEPVAFDALEFDPVFAAGDLLYDLAFLLMDLVERGLPRAANIVLNGYFSATRRSADLDGIAALAFFMSLRAAIRAKVAAARLDMVEAADKAGIAEAAKRYFELALALLAPAKPVVVGVGGMSGTGKSVMARSLAPLLPPRPGALVLRSDVERKALYAVAEHDRLPPQAYQPDVSAKLYRTLIDKAARVAAAGHSVIVDAVFAKPDERHGLEQAAAAAGAEFRGLFLVADLPTRLHRIGSRGPDASDADAAVARQQEDYDLGAMRWTIVDAAGTPEQTLAKARAAINQRD